MKHTFCILTALLLCLLAGCGKEPPAPLPETTEPGLLLVGTKPTEPPTEPETVPETTLPAILQDSKTAQATEAPEKDTRPAPTEAPQVTEAPKGSAPLITKQPTGETVKEGEEAWFVARAEEVQSISWQLLSPDRSQTQTPEQITDLFPDLKVETKGDDTLILKNIPLDMNGWAVEAEFRNPSGSARTEPAALTVTEQGPAQLSSAYDPVLENCRSLLRFDPDTDSMDALARNDPYNLREGWDLMGGGLGYALEDLDGNGVQELILGCAGSNGFGDRGDDMVFALFTLQGNTPVKLAQSWARNRHYLSKDNYIYNEGSNSADSSSFTMQYLEGTRLITAASLWTEGTDDRGNLRAFYSPEGIPDAEHSRRVHDDRFYELQAGMIASRRPLPPLTDILAY